MCSLLGLRLVSVSKSGSLVIPNESLELVGWYWNFKVEEVRSKTCTWLLNIE